jgi:hypothetical protein
MDNPCYKCGHTVEEGTPFCPHCGAPQIRVVLATAPASASSSAAIAANAANGIAGPPIAGDAVLHGARVFRPCALAAVAASILVLLGLNLFVALLGAGFLAVVFYRQQMPGLSVKAAAGARLGALSGLLFFACLALVSAAGVVVMGGAKAREQIYEGAQKWMASRAADPQMQAALDQFKTPDGFAVALIGGCLLLLVFCVVLACIGGSLGGIVFGPRDRT